MVVEPTMATLLAAFGYSDEVAQMPQLHGAKEYASDAC
jgi:hypothetical protein